MEKQALYTDAQWRWAAEKRAQGYSITALAEFLGVHAETVRRNFRRIGVLGTLPPLDKAEFNRVGDDG